MIDESGGPSELFWNRSQRHALLALLAVLLVYLTVRFALNRQHISDPQPDAGSRSPELMSKINPNEADWQTLSTIPTLGEKRAREIIAYRDRVRSAAPAGIAFTSAADLLRVRGIGQATMENISPYLTFPKESPADPGK